MASKSSSYSARNSTPEHKIGVSGLYPDFPPEVGRAYAGLPGGEGRLQGQRQDPRGQRECRLSLEPVLGAGKKERGQTAGDHGRARRKQIGDPGHAGAETNGSLRDRHQADHRLVFKKYGFCDSLRLGFNKTVESVDLTFITLKKLLTFNLSIKTLGGPVMIAQMSGTGRCGGAIVVSVLPGHGQHLPRHPEPAADTDPGRRPASCSSSSRRSARSRSAAGPWRVAQSIGAAAADHADRRRILQRHHEDVLYEVARANATQSANALIREGSKSRRGAERQQFLGLSVSSGCDDR